MESYTPEPKIRDRIITDSDAERVLHDIVYSDNPDSTYNLIHQSDPEIIQAALERSEVQIAEAGAAYETGLRRKSERKRLENAFGEHQVILGAAAKHMLLRHTQLSDREEHAKRDVVDFMLESKRRIIESDVHTRLEASMVERAKENMAQSKLRMKLGKFAVHGATAGAGIGAIEAVEAGMGELSLNLGAKLGVGALAVFTTLTLMKVGARAASRTASELSYNKFAFYTLGKETPQSSHTTTEVPEAVITDAAEEATDEEAVHERLARYHIQQTRPKLAEILIDADLQSGKDSPDTFITKLVEKLDESLDAFYHITYKVPAHKKVRDRAANLRAQFSRK